MVNNSLLSAYYHPTKVLFIDDNKEFLDTIEMAIPPKINCIMTSDTEEAIRLIGESKEEFRSLIFNVVDQNDTDSMTGQIVRIDFANILKFIENKSRIDFLSVVVVDYDMPGQNGVEFCHSIQDSPVTKIMLTAAADHKTAIAAFNNGTIDKFLDKTSPNLDEELTNAILEMQSKYFERLTKSIIDSVNINRGGLFASSKYKELVTKIMEESLAVEYYLVDESGSILFLDSEANPTWLVVRSIADFSRFLEIAEGYDASKEIKAALHNKKKLLFLLTEIDMKKPISNWGEYLFEANKLDENHYYSIIKEKTKNAIDWNRIIPCEKKS